MKREWGPKIHAEGSRARRKMFFKAKLVKISLAIARKFSAAKKI